MEGNYWDIDALIAEEESIPNIFLTTGANLAFLDPLAKRSTSKRSDSLQRRRGEDYNDDEEEAIGEEDLPAGSQVNLPLWLTEEMVCIHKNTINKIFFVYAAL